MQKHHLTSMAVWELENLMKEDSNVFPPPEVSMVEIFYAIGKFGCSSKSRKLQLRKL